ncbi:hypothetical protein D9753_32355 [Streptomyces dangxiongensis]|uniref:Uncharacterized protein n=1 Tax=Streptomyces dangxiongensis TaxID=1442032 RepID=A0A3G2JMH8_9ACTN|nr:hypothetical protein D9753_32355 [Streptomyces dangxiongensis]
MRLGPFTRGAAVARSGSMAYACFSVHQPHALFPIDNGGEPAVLFCWPFLLIPCLGPGACGVDALPRNARSAAGADEIVGAEGPTVRGG